MSLNQISGWAQAQAQAQAQVPLIKGNKSSGLGKIETNLIQRPMYVNQSSRRAQDQAPLVKLNQLMGFDKGKKILTQRPTSLDLSITAGLSLNHGPLRKKKHTETGLWQRKFFLGMGLG